MNNKTNWGCLLGLILFLSIFMILKIGVDFLENGDMCYEYVPFCESKEEKETDLFNKAKSTIDNKVENISRKSSPKKWHTITEYQTSNGGYLYYLGTNSLNGVYLYWNGNPRNIYLYSLDYQAQDKLGVKIYEGNNRLELMDEFLLSEQAENLDEDFSNIFK